MSRSEQKHQKYETYIYTLGNARDVILAATFTLARQLIHRCRRSRLAFKGARVNFDCILVTNYPDQKNGEIK